MSFFNQQEQALIIGQSATFIERATDSRYQPISSQSSEKIEQILSQWRKALGTHNQDALHKRLAWDNFTEDEARQLLGDMVWNGPVNECRWMSILDNYLTELSLECKPLIDDYLMIELGNDPVPFQHIFYPIVNRAMRELSDKVDFIWSRLSDKAQAKLAYSLSKKLGSLSEFVFFAIFDQFRIQAKDAKLPEQNGDAIYQSFIDYLLDDGLHQIFLNYPVLAKFWGQSIEIWQESYAEFLQRLEIDWDDITKKFGGCHCVTDFRLELSDPHNRGRTVHILTIDDQTRVVYKPKPIAIDAAYFAIVDWIEEQGFPLDFKKWQVIARTEYGWVEFIEQKPCGTIGDVKQYYQRAGTLLCLWYVLGGSDGHHENVIVHGEYPVLFDLETLMAPLPKEMGKNGLSEFHNLSFDTVITTGLLPSQNLDTKNDLSGLGLMKTGKTKMPGWKNINQDTMKRTILEKETTLGTNVVQLHDEIQPSSKYVAEICWGFEQMYHFLVDNRQQLIQTELLARLAAYPTRFLFRNTDVYGKLLQRTVHPQFLQHGIATSLELDRTAIAFMSLKEQPAEWLIQRAEVHDMLQGDIPFFASRPIDTVLYTSTGDTIDNYFASPSLDNVLQRLHRLGADDLAQQLDIVKTALSSQNRMDFHGLSDEYATDSSLDFDTKSSVDISKQLLLGEAKQIADFILQLAKTDSNSYLNWYGMQYFDEIGRYQLGPLKHGFYEGLSGVAVFLMAYAKVTGNSEIEELVTNKVIKGITQRLNELDAKNKRQLSKFYRAEELGTSRGASSLVYSFATLARLSAHKDLLDSAEKFADLISPEYIYQDTHIDLLRGVAGTALALLSLHNLNNSNRVLSLARHCGEHLLATRQPSPYDGLRAWPTVAGQLGTGLSHGAAGIILALVRLYAVTRDNRYLEAAKEGIAYEHATFSTEYGNWPDLRNPNEINYVSNSSWCNGAPGIAIGRAAGLAVLDSDLVRSDIQRAVDFTLSQPIRGVDHLCCGNLGRLFILQSLARTIKDSELQAQLRNRLQLVIKRKYSRGHYTVSSKFPLTYCLGMFQGLAGIGYSLLYLADPTLPDILAIQ